MVFRSAVFMVASVATVGCLDSEPCLPTGSLGSCCDAQEDCEGLKCFEELPGGLCTKSCEEGVGCPEEGHCAEVTYSGDKGAIQGKYCLRACGSGWPDCRDDYMCKQIDDESNQQVCFVGSG